MIGSGLGIYLFVLLKVDFFDVNGNGYVIIFFGILFFIILFIFFVVVIWNFFNDMDEKLLCVMFVFFKDFVSIEFFFDDKGFCVVYLKFKSFVGVFEVKNNFDGKFNYFNDVDIIVEIIGLMSFLFMGK